MDHSGFPSLGQVRDAHPGELAVLLSTLPTDAVSTMDAASAEAVVVATQRVANWVSAVQSLAVDRFAEHVLDAQEHHAAELVAVRDAHRAGVEASGEVWRGDTGAVALPEPEQVAASMLAPELRISPRTMRTRLNRARSLMELPTTLSLALAGELEPWRVDAVVVASRDVGADRLLELEARLYASDVTALPRPRLVERVQRAAVKADPESVTRGVQRAPRRRSLRVAPSDTAGLMTWTLQVPDDLSRRLFAAVDALAQEYLTADRHVTGTGTRTATMEAAPHGRGSLTVEAARLDALGDLVMANAEVRTVVELVVPVDAGTRALTTRPTPREAALAAVRPRAPRGPRARRRSGTAVDETHVDETHVDEAHVDETDVDGLLVDLVLGSVTTATLAAGQLERHLGLVLGAHVEVEANPFLTRGPSVPSKPPRPTAPPGADPPTTWFVDGLVEAPGAAALLPEQVVALLADPDTGLRITSGEAGSADGDLARRRTYRPRKALAAKVRARDRRCRFPGCSVPAVRCHLDHVVPHPVGDTTEANLQSLCPAHHGFKHHAGWTVTMTPDGTCRWTTPAGTTHTTTPASARDAAA